MELVTPRGMLAVLRHQGGDDLWQQAGKLAAIAAQPIAQDRDRIVGKTGGVIPALQRGDTKLHIQAIGIAPGLGRKFLQRGKQLPGQGRCGQQRADDREAQPRPAIAGQRNRTSTQSDLPWRRHERATDGIEDYAVRISSTIYILCGKSAALTQRDRARRQRRQELQPAQQRIGNRTGKVIQQTGRKALPSGGGVKACPRPATVASAGTASATTGANGPRCAPRHPQPGRQLRGRRQALNRACRHQHHRQHHAHAPAQEAHRPRGHALAADVAAKADARSKVGAIRRRQPTGLALIVRPMQHTAARTSLSPRLRRKLDIDTQQRAPERCGHPTSAMAQSASLLVLVNLETPPKGALFKLPEGDQPADITLCDRQRQRRLSVFHRAPHPRRARIETGAPQQSDAKSMSRASPEARAD